MTSTQNEQQKMRPKTHTPSSLAPCRPNTKTHAPRECRPQPSQPATPTTTPACPRAGPGAAPRRACWTSVTGSHVGCVLESHARPHGLLGDCTAGRPPLFGPEPRRQPIRSSSIPFITHALYPKDQTNRRKRNRNPRYGRCCN